jgi:hypothetical protein
VLSISPNIALMLFASVLSGGNGRPGYISGGWCGDGSMSCWKVVYTYPMPSFSAADRRPAAAGIMPVATSASHPAAASVTALTASNWPANSSAACPVASVRADRPAGTSSKPTSATRSAKFGGAHTRTSAPRARSCTASPSIGSTSPREP